MEMREIPEELYESYPAMSAKYHADMIEEYVQKRLTASQARLSEAVKVLEAYLNEYEGVYDMAATKERPAYRSDGAKAAEDAVRQFLATLGEENEA